MAIPVADQRTAKGEVMEYWDWLFGEITPFPHITNWETLPAYMKEIKKDYPHNMIAKLCSHDRIPTYMTAKVYYNGILSLCIDGCLRK